MSAQLSQHVTTRLLIAEKSENSAYALDSTLRDAGIATKLTISDDLAHIAQQVSEGHCDIVLLTDKIDGLEQILPRIREQAPRTPILLLTQEQTSWTTPAAMHLGITDVVEAGDAEHLALVVKRELEHVCQHEHFAQVRRALKEAEQRCQLLLQGSKAAIAYIHEGMHIHANEGYLELFGYNNIDELCGESLIDILAAESAAELKTQLKAIRNGADESGFNFTSSGDKPVHGHMTLANAQYEGEHCLQITVRQQQNSANAATAPSDASTPAEATPQDTPRTDSLELPGFVKAAQSLFTNDTDQPFLLVCALDNYTELQAAYGLVGVEVICRKVWHKLAELADVFPATRLNNNQFALAITATNRDNATQIADRIRNTIGEMIFEVQDKTVRPTLTIAGDEVDEQAGISKTLDLAYQNLLDMLTRNQTNVVKITAPVEMSATSENDDARVILRQITDAIENKAFMLLFQPIISLRGDSDEHYEVFLRMTDSDGAQIQPGRFLQTAIDNNVAGKIDRWVILQSIKMLSVHRAKGHATRLTINLTANSVTDSEFLQWLGVAIKAARLPSDAVIFQVTEKDATTYLRQTREFVEGLRNMHCRASLSRFGLIEDPFETLRHLPVDMVKLDGSCIEGIDENKARSDKLIEDIKKLQGSGKLTVVPMVENANVLSTLWQAGANYIQGHYLQEPTTNMDYDFNTEE
ncbi:MAG: EAL domain-containing protein [bacterium]